MAILVGTAMPQAAFATPPELDADPFRPPPGQGAPSPDKPAKDPKKSVFYARPTVGFVARFSPDRRFLPKEGFGFSIEAGAVLGSGSRLRFALGLAYEYMRVARSMDIYVGSTELTSCTELRSASYHMALGQAVAWMDFAPVSLWMGLSGGFVHGALRTPNEDCSSSEKAVPQATLGPDFGIAYHLRPDLWLGVYLRSRHFFSDKRLVTAEGVDQRVFHPLLTTGISVTLRF
ncbi:MAG: hypothetical protein RBU30_00625 [Polyangia bacterium]|nr:hypothetical protein [Polyangia bacterium]